MVLRALLNKLRSLVRKEDGTLMESIHEEEAFQGILHQQMCRADRSRHDLAMAVFIPVNDWEADGLLDRFLNLLSDRKRCFDEIGWYGRNGLAIVLPDTTLEGARTFADSIIAALQAQAPEQPQFAIYTYTPEEIRDRGRTGEEKSRTMERRKPITTR